MEMLLTIEQAADRLQLHRDTVRRQLKRGALRGVKRGRVWRVPESALTEAATPTGSVQMEVEADAIWQQMTSGKAGDHNAAIIKMANAPAPVRAIIARRSAEAAAIYYATPAGNAELADWRALGSDISDDDYYSDEEEAEFRAKAKAKAGAGR